MKNLFAQTKKALSMVMVLALFVTQFSSLLFQTPKTYALGNFTTNELVANAPAGAPITGVQSVTQFNVVNTADDGDITSIAGCDISIVSGGVADSDCTDGAGLLDPTVDVTEAQQAAKFATFTFNDYISTTGALPLEFILTHTGIPINGNAPSYNVTGNDFLFIQYTVAGLADQPATPAVAQVVEFIPTLPMTEDTFLITLDGFSYATTVLSGGTVQEIVEILQRWTLFLPAINCTEDDVKITCTAATGGIAFTYAATVLDQTPPVVTLSGFSPVAILQNSVYVDAGATWTDGNDGSGTILVATSGTVDTNTVGTYYLEYTKVDAAGNTGNIVTRTVNVYRPIDGGGYIVTPIPTPGSQNQTTNPETNTETSIDLNDLLNPTIDSSLCYTMNDKKIIDQGNGVSLNFMKSLQVLLNFDLTTIPGTKDYNPERSLTRAEAAKFLSLFAQNILCRETTKSYPAGLFKDLGQTDAGLQSYIKLSYEYEIFRGDVGGMFRPNDIISRDELIAVIVRLVTNEYDNAQGTDRAANYKATLNSNTSIPLTSVKRGNTAEVIYDLYRNNDYSMDADLGFVLR